MSWHESVAVGSTYTESDEKITHQIVDRPSMDKQYLSRYGIRQRPVMARVCRGRCNIPRVR